MALITLPTGGIKSIEWTQPEWGGFVVRSGWTAKQTVGDLGNVRAGWKAKVTLTDRRVATLLPWRAFFALAKGPVNTFVLNVTDAAQPAPFNDLAVQGSGQTGQSINLRTTHPSTFFLPAGSTIRISSTFADWQTFILTADLTSASTGYLTAALDRPMRSSYADGATVEIVNVGVVMRLATPTSGWSVQPGRIYTPFAFECEEAIGA